MENNEILDTSDLLTEQDYRDIADLTNIRKRIFAYIDINAFILNIIEIIERTPFLNFKNERSKKYIDNRRPIFYINMNEDYIKHSDRFGKKFNEAQTSKKAKIELYSNIIYEEITIYITNYIRESLRQNPDLENYIYERDIFKNMEMTERKIVRDSTAVLSTMVGLRFSEENPAQITYEILM